MRGASASLATTWRASTRAGAALLRAGGGPSAPPRGGPRAGAPAPGPAGRGRGGPGRGGRAGSASGSASASAAASKSTSTKTSSTASTAASRGLAAASSAAAAAEAAAAARPCVVETLKARGLLQDCTGEAALRAAAGEGAPLKVYCGFDPTADCLHLGNLLGILVLAWFSRCGHDVVALVGGATGRVGDPSGKSAERPVLDVAAIEHNARCIGALLEDLLSRAAAGAAGRGGGFALANNLDWYGGMELLDFLRGVGKFARMGTMLGKDSVKTRLASEAGLSFTEFSYQLLQGYDFAHLYREAGVNVQVGGSDQWGNILAGTDLIRKLHPAGGEDAAQEEGKAAGGGAHGLTFPLLLTADGKKFGKSEGGALWLRANKLSPYKFYQYLFATPDADVAKFLRMLTFLDLDEIAALEASMAAEGYRPNTVQRRLAEEVTRFVHGEEGLQLALNATAALAPGSKTVLDAPTLVAIKDDVPNSPLARAEVVGAPLADVMAKCGIQPSKAAARRMIKGGGVRVNNTRVTEDDYALADADVLRAEGGNPSEAQLGLVLVTAGKKNKHLVTVE